jgi:Tol biopolymer transport system component
MKKILVITAAFLLLSSILGSFALQTGTDQFQKALAKERGEGNLEEAIALYQKVINETKDEALAAQAQLRIGICYEKLGREKSRQALEAFQKVLDKYPAQTETVKAARDRLAQLAKAEEPGVRKPTFRKIRTPFNIPQWSGGRLSPDGKSLAFGSGKAIWTVPMPGRVDPELAGEPKELPGATDVLGDGLAWSGDGRWIAFSRAYEHIVATRIAFRPEGAHIDVIPSSGGEPKRIPVPQWVATKGDTYRRLSLSHDGKTVAFDAGGQIFIASVETGDIRQITKDGGISPCFSPDGTRIAYLTPPVRQDNPPARLHEVWVISVDGKDPVKISGELRENLSVKGPTWSPDGKMIAFGRINRGSSVGAELCIVQVPETGKSVEPPVRIELPQFSTDFLAGWTPDNRIGLLLETPYRESVYTVPVAGGKATQVSPLHGIANHPRWTPDGKRIFFRWKQGGIGSVPSDGGEVSVHTGFEGARSETGLFINYPGAGMSISPDGRSIAFAGGTAKSGPYVYTIPVAGGGPTQITTKGGRPCWSPDGRWIAYLADESIAEGKDIASIFIVPKDGGEARKITNESHNVSWAGIDWSPDGRSIVYFSKKADSLSGTLNVVSVDGGEQREVCQAQNIRPHDEVSWSPDGRRLAFASKGKIWIVPAAGGDPVEVKTDVDAWAGMLDWSPDGQRIAFSGDSGMDVEFWFMENFLPLVKK